MNITLDYSGDRQIEVFVPAGETFTVNGVKLRCEINEVSTENDICEGCYYYNDEWDCENTKALINFDCGEFRQDENTVIFREVKE